jgi:hypothetical protein
MALSDALEEGLQAHDLREQLTRQALEDIAMSHSDWSSAIDRIFAYMTCPESTAGRPELPVSAAVASPV